ncbi:hypothetical protein [Thermus sediminis]|uniref:hypothetical protein n=1 Tax=Thermus sediminis TaxID=1761908 RepID=UPI002FCDE11A
MRLLDHLLPHLHLGFPMEAREGTRVPWRRATLQVLAITLHNTPKGLAVAWPLKRAGVRAGPARFYG